MENQEKKVIKISEVLALIEEGKTRVEIRKELDLNTTEMKNLFAHPLLKNRKARKIVSEIIIEDDVSGSKGVEADILEEFEQAEMEEDVEVQEEAEMEEDTNEEGPVDSQEETASENLQSPGSSPWDN